MIGYLLKGGPVAAMLGLAACTGSTDPQTASVFDNYRNLQTGEYDRQIAAKDAQAAAIISNNRAAEGRIDRMQGQRAANASQIAALTSQIAAVRAEAASARRQLAGDPAGTARLQQLESQITAIQADVGAGANPAASRAELSQVSAAIRALTS